MVADCKTVFYIVAVVTVANVLLRIGASTMDNAIKPLFCCC